MVWHSLREHKSTRTTCGPGQLEGLSSDDGLQMKDLSLLKVLARDRCPSHGAEVKFSERKQEAKRLTLVRQGWKPSISWPQPSEFNVPVIPGSKREVKRCPHPSFPQQDQNGSHCASFPLTLGALQAQRLVQYGMGIVPGITESPPTLMYLQVCLDLFPLPASLNISSLLHSNSCFGYTIRWSPPNLKTWI